MTQTATRTPEIISTPKVTTSCVLFDGSQEIWASYKRSDDVLMYMSVTTPGTNDPGAFFIGEGTQEETDSDIEAREVVTLSLSEARILRDLLNRPDVQALLDTQH